MKTLDNNVMTNPFVIIGLVLLFFGLIILIIILVKRHVKPLQIKKDEIDEKEAVRQELDRILVPIEDENIQKEMEEKAISETKPTDEKKD